MANMRGLSWGERIYSVSHGYGPFGKTVGRIDGSIVKEYYTGAGKVMPRELVPVESFGDTVLRPVVAAVAPIAAAYVTRKVGGYLQGKATTATQRQLATEGTNIFGSLFGNVIGSLFGGTPGSARGYYTPQPGAGYGSLFSPSIFMGIY